MLVSQVSPGRKNHLHLEVAGEHASVRFEQERPETLWVGRRERTEELWRDATYLSPAAARHTVVPVGHPQGYLDCFDAFVADTYAAIAGEQPDGLPRFADGVRAARVTDAVLRIGRRRSVGGCLTAAPRCCRCRGSARASSASRCCTASTSTCAPARSTRSSARTAPASRRW